jgi:hypothetical protein
MTCIFYYLGTWSNGGDHGAMTFLSGYGGQMAGADQGMHNAQQLINDQRHHSFVSIRF